MSRIITTLLLLAIAVGASSCVPATIAATGIVAVGTVDTVDAVLSRKLDQDCAVINLLEGPYCRSRTLPNPQAPVYCYRTLGGVDCHAQADPYAVERERVTAPRALAMPVQPAAPAVRTLPAALTIVEPATATPVTAAPEPIAPPPAPLGLDPAPSAIAAPQFELEAI
jgi:hypothetical protein